MGVPQTERHQPDLYTAPPAVQQSEVEPAGHIGFVFGGNAETAVNRYEQAHPLRVPGCIRTYKILHGIGCHTRLGEACDCDVCIVVFDDYPAGFATRPGLFGIRRTVR